MSGDSQVLAEFQHWCGEQFGDSFIYQTSDHQCLRNGGVRLNLGLSGGEEFILICEDGYPNEPSASFQLRCEDNRLREWTRAMEMYINENRGHVKLGAVLTKALKTYSDGARRVSESPSTSYVQLPDSDYVYDVDDDNMEVDEQESSDDGFDGDENFDSFTTAFEIRCDMRKKRWLAKEHELREKWERERVEMEKKNETEPTTVMYGGVVLRRPDTAEVTVKEGQQIYEHSGAAFQILSNEMISLLRTGEQDGFVVDTIDDSLYTWDVKISSFPKDSTLHSDLKQMNHKFGYGYVQLQLDFVPDFPFYPPLLRVVRPRFRGSLVQSLANIELLSLSYWNPTKTIREVLTQIRDILLLHARLDIDAPRNDAAMHPEGGYLPLEDHLIKLALATEVRPRATFQIIDVGNLEKAPRIKRKRQEDTTSAHGKPKTGWAKGTGYGSGRMGSNWNPTDWIKAKQEKDRQILRILRDVLEDLDKLEEQIVDDTEAFAVIEGSALISFLESELDQPSFIEISRHLELYHLLLELVSKLGEKPQLLRLMCPLERQNKCLMALLQSLSETAAKYLDQLDRFKGEDQPAGSKPKAKTRPKAALGAFGALVGWNVGAAAQASEPEQEEMTEDTERANAQQIVEVFEKLQTQMALFDMNYAPSASNHSLSSSSSSSTQATTSETLDDFYCAQLRDLQFKDYTDVGAAGVANDHKFSGQKNSALTGKSMRAIFKEMTALRQSLPLDARSSIFVRTDDTQAALLQAMITGPEDTPYANGCFLFDICFPPTYPQAPPQVKIATTGGGKVRFNPNLYNCGKVCLSLLGTWSGSSGETWNPNTSTLLQVLVSIQSLILIDDPYFNEPGYEGSRGTDDGTKRSEAYNKEVRYNCVQWAIHDMLKNPPTGFDSVVRTHFKLKRDVVIKQLEEWRKADSRLEKELKGVKDLLSKL